MSTITKTTDEVVVFNIQPWLNPIAIFMSGLLISLSLYFSLAGLTIGAAGAPAVDKGPLYGIAEDLGINGDDLLECIARDDGKEEIQKDLADGGEAGVTGTPAFIIGTRDGDTVSGILVPGALPYASFAQIIDYYTGGASEFDPADYEVTTVSIDDDPYIGGDNAEVVVVEFSDFECPYCKQFHETTFDQLKENYIDNNKIGFVFRDFPLSFHDPVATEYAVAANCVYELEGDEKYFEFNSAVFEATLANGQGIPQ